MAQEVEAKFYVQKLDVMQQRLEAIGAKLTDPRVKETNLRFDTPGRHLTQAGLVLRLRQDTRARLTYKGADANQTGALSRREIEFTVSDFDAARELLEALGYRIALIYEKFRTTYKLDNTEIMLDEMPYGNFIEIEGQGDRLRPIADKLGLKWDAAVQESYSGLFDRLRQRRGLKFRDLTFDNLKDVSVSPGDLGVKSADP